MNSKGGDAMVKVKVHFRPPGTSETLFFVYVHATGLPEGKDGVLAYIKRFLDDVRSQDGEAAFSDPVDLCTRFGMFSGPRMPDDVHKALAKLQAATQGPYRYVITCDGRPTVKAEKIGLLARLFGLT
jgi:hypothetical protein